MSVAVAERGVDTWRLLWRPGTPAGFKRAREWCSEKGVMPFPVAGHRVGYLPMAGGGYLWMEGHPAEDGLAGPGELESCLARVVDSAENVGLPIGGGLAGVSRCDSTATTKWEKGGEGIAILRGMAALDVPRMKPAVYGRPPQTVYLQGARSRTIYGRVYDKGVEASLAAPGHLVRFEDQRRFDSKTRRMVENLEPAAFFDQRFAEMRRAAEGIRAMSLPVMQRELAEQVVAGDIAYREAERLLGYVTMMETGVGASSVRTTERRRRELRDRGLVVADDFFEPVSVNLGETLDAVVEAWSA